MTNGVGSARAAQSEPPYPPQAYSSYVLALLCAAYMFSYIDRALLNLLTEPIKADLGLSDTEISLLQGFAVSVCFAVAGIPIARLADRGSRSLIVSVGAVLWSVASSLTAFAGSLGALFAARVAVGVGEATLMPSTYSLLPDLFPKEQIGRATATFTMGGALGAAAGMIIGGAVIAALVAQGGLTLPGGHHLAPWQATFFVMGAPGLLLALLIFLTVREPARRGGSAEAQTQDAGRVIDTIRAHPLTFASLFLAFPLAVFVFNGWLAWAPALLIRKFAMTAESAAMLMGAVFFFAGVSGVLSSGVVNDMLYRRGVKDAPFWLSIVSALALGVSGALAPLATQVWVFAIPFSVFIFFGSYISIVPIVAIQMIVPNRQRAQISAVFIFLGTLVGGGLGPTGVALLTDQVFRDDALVGYSLSLTSAVLMPLTAALLVIGLKPYKRSLAAAE